MKRVFKLLILVCCLMASVEAFSQSQLATPFLNSGSQYFYRSGARELYTDIKGEPFLFADWSKGSITTDFAQTDNLNMLYNEVDDQLIFKVAKKDVRKVVLPVKEFNIVDKENGNNLRKFKAGFAPTKFSTERTFFEVLVDRKTTLLKKNLKSISQNREYSGQIARTVVNSTNYYIVSDNNVPTKVKLNEKSVKKLLSAKQANVEEYIQSNQLNLKQQDDLVKLVNYYNTL
jgi:hypothetical protein